ncbi:MAG: FixH family protein [Pseudobdellovibrio sp.]
MINIKTTALAFATLAFLSLPQLSVALTHEHPLDETPSQQEDLIIGCTSEQNYCAQVVFATSPTSRSESEFIVKFIKTPSTITPENVKVILWMNMGHGGHGSAPVEINRLSENEYHITKAYFVMSGKWEIKINFTSSESDIKQQIILPVVIK